MGLEKRYIDPNKHLVYGTKYTQDIPQKYFYNISWQKDKLQKTIILETIEAVTKSS